VGLLGWPLLIVCILIATALPVGCALVWARLGGPPPLQMAARMGMIVLCQLTAVAAVGVTVNKHFQFFASWDDLWGSTGSGGGIQQANAAPPPPGDRARVAGPQLLLQPDGAYQTTFTGERSHIRSRVWIWLPPEYHEKAYENHLFPVVELFPGYPGTASTWFGTMQGAQHLTEEIAAHRAQPMILVAPTITVDPGHDTECTDIPGGPQVATWLTDDVRSMVLHSFHAATDRTGWATMGYSTGGFCAVKIVAQYPQLFRAGVSLSGYFTPLASGVGGDPALRLRNTVANLLESRPPVAFLLGASWQDPGTVPAANGLLKAVKAPTEAFTYFVPKGGHNTGVWTAMLPRSYDWLSKELTAR
jgi:enterochelin esterase-like enzyme